MADRTPEDDRLRELMRGAQRGDAAAYRELLETVSERVRRVVRRRRGFVGPDAVEDLVQDVLLSVHAVRATYDPDRPFLPWLLAIVRNRLADGARRYVRRGAREVQVDDLEVTFADLQANTIPEEPIGLETLTQAIGALPPGQRQAIELLKLRELSLKEASRATGLSVGALKLATHRAMGTLRRVLGKTEADAD